MQKQSALNKRCLYDDQQLNSKHWSLFCSEWVCSYKIMAWSVLCHKNVNCTVYYNSRLLLSNFNLLLSNLNFNVFNNFTIKIIVIIVNNVAERPNKMNIIYFKWFLSYRYAVYLCSNCLCETDRHNKECPMTYSSRFY